MKRYLILFAGLTVLASSCEDFLTKEDPNAIDAPSYFRTEADLEAYANGFIQNIIPDASDIATGDANADNMARRGEYAYLTDAFGPTDQGGWSWTQLRNINYFLDNFRNADVTEEVMNHYEATARYWRAYFYFNKVRQFGDVPWYEHVIEPDDKEALYKGRDERGYVMGKVLEDLDFACENLMVNSKLLVNSSRIHKYTALALKSRVMLFEGTWYKYHDEQNLANRIELAQKYLEECVKACEELMASRQYSLYHGNDATKQYRELFTSETPITREVIWARVYSESLMRTHQLTWLYTGQNSGSNWSLTKQFVNTYLMSDGTRFTDKTGYETTEFWNEVAGRDLRLQQTIRTPGYTRTVNGVAGVRSAPDFAASVTGYQICKWVIDDSAYEQASSGCWNSIPIFRYAEILLNYAEAMWELGRFDDTVWDATIRPIRERAGVKGDAPATYDPYIADYFLNFSTDKYILEIRRERGIELLMENVRWNDINRWKMGQMLERPWYGVYIPALDTNYDMDQNGSDDVCFVMEGNTPSIPSSGVYYKELGTDFVLTEGTRGYLNCYVRANRVWRDFKYLRPVPESALIQNPNLGQNDGWD